MIKTLRNKKPIVHCITNYVTVNDVANVILAVGGSPIMADDIQEVYEIASISSSLVINVGTLNARTIESMIAAGKRANEIGIPVILDPVGAGASTLRNNTVKRLMSEIKFALVRGNLSEVSFIAGLEVQTKGVDTNVADDKGNAVEVAMYVSKKFNTIAAITGAVDIIASGNKIAKVANGDPLMGNVTGTGCMLSGVLGAFLGANDDHFQATVCAISAMGIAGALSAEKYAEIGTGSFHIGIIDELSKINDEKISTLGKITYENY